MTDLERLEAQRLRWVSRRALHEHRLAMLTAERDRLYLGVFVLLAASVVGATLSAFDLVDAGGGYLCLLAGWAVRAEWRRNQRETMAEYHDYIAFTRTQLGEAAA